MGRKVALLIGAALIAALGAGLVFLYAHGADSRAQAAQDPVQVLKATSQIPAGQTLQQASDAGKLQLGNVPRTDVLPGAVSTVGSLGGEVATTTIYPGEQIISGKFAASSADVPSALTMPTGDFAISVTLTDTGRVAGFVQPGNNVAIFVNTTDQSTGSGSAAAGQDTTRLLLPKVEVIAVGATTVVSRTTTTTTGTQTTEQLPNTLFTLAVNQKEAQKIMFAAGHGELNFGLLNAKSHVTSEAGTTTASLFR